MGKHLSDAELRRYHDDGFVFPIDILNPREALDCRRRLEAFEAEHGKMKYAMKPYLTMLLADELAHHPALLDAAEDVIGPNLLLWDGAFIIKEPHDDRFISWHQDLTYWGVEPAEGVVSVWLALSPVGPENGGMRVIPGSHAQDILPHADTFEADNLLSRGQTIAAEIDEDSAVDMRLAPGQMSLHHGRVVHGSNPSHSDERRIGLNFQFIAPEVRQTAIDNDMALLVRGADTCGQFEPEARPAADLDPAALALVAEIARRRHKLLFRGAEADEAELNRRYGAA